MGHYINNSLHLAQKYARIFVRGRYLFQEGNSFPRVKLEENCELRVIVILPQFWLHHVTCLDQSRARKIFDGSYREISPAPS